MTKIIPSILTTNLKDFKEKLKILEEFADTIQIDIMDGEFVDNISFDLKIGNHDLNQYLNQYLNTNTKLELHLMVNHPLEYIKKWQDIKNVSRIIFHIESKDNINKVIQKIKSYGFEVGIAINPETPIEKLEPYLNKIDQVLFMTVVPGKQGGKFIPEIGEKIKILKKIKNLHFINNPPLIAIDGGINEKTIKEIKTWELDIIGIGSAIIKKQNPELAYKEIKKMI